MKYIKKRVVVDAIQWRPDPEGQEPKGVVLRPTESQKYIFESPSGAVYYLNSGDWIVSESENAKFVVAEANFDQLYEPTTEKAKEESAKVDDAKVPPHRLPEPEPKPAPRPQPTPPKKGTHRK
jgi:hypothetical protein